MSSWNDDVIAEFRANGGHVGGRFEQIRLLLLHSVGRRSGLERVTPLSYLTGDDGRRYIFAADGGAASHPDWYHNVIAAGAAVVEIGSERHPVQVTEIVGADRERLYAELLRQRPDLDTYVARTSRVIPILALDPV
jgi:deazaflavin-dependent oxidoreductase (nitroreductase family)